MLVLSAARVACAPASWAWACWRFFWLVVLAEAMLAWSDWTVLLSDVTVAFSLVTLDWSCATLLSSVEQAELPLPEDGAEPPAAQSAASFCWSAESLASSEVSWA